MDFARIESERRHFMNQVKWYKSLSFLGLIGLTLIPLWDMAGIVIIMRISINKN